eukprot:c16407_g1_i2 orf=100-1209(+)
MSHFMLAQISFMACLLIIGQVMSLHEPFQANLEEALFLENSNFKVDELPPIVSGLSWTFYNTSCPKLENIVHTAIKPFLDDDITQAAGILRLHFHDCFVQGCDASVLLDGTTTEPSEKSATPNLTLRPEAFKIINSIKASVEALCPNIVSCADILTLAARASVAKAKGPSYAVPLGRRDSLVFANTSVILANLPAPTSNVTGLIDIFSSKGLDFTDLVALSGGHTIGRAHCSAFANRLNPLDPNLDLELASQLTTLCRTSNSTNFTGIDVFTPNRFDNQYYRGLLQRYGLFTSDESLVLDARTNATVESYYANKTLFFEQFGLSMIKMGQLDVIMDTQGEIRTNCSMPNSASLSTIHSNTNVDLPISSS